MHHLNFQLYGSLPFFELIQAIREIESALKQQCKVYVHCQEGRVRSAVFLASYLFMTEGKDISEAILQVNRCLDIDL
jgi:protein-tyrosine phosphatase